MARIVTVDHSRIAAAKVAYLLRDEGHEIFVESSVREALALLNRVGADGIVVEIGNPAGVNAAELCDHLRQHPRFRDMAIVLIGTRDDEQDLIAGMAAGADGYLIKPVDRRCLAQQLQHALQCLQGRMSEAHGGTSPQIAAPFGVPRASGVPAEKVITASANGEWRRTCNTDGATR
jgi:DNA-binding response OmpR family regulator